MYLYKERSWGIPRKIKKPSIWQQQNRPTWENHRCETASRIKTREFLRVSAKPSNEMISPFLPLLLALGAPSWCPIWTLLLCVLHADCVKRKNFFFCAWTQVNGLLLLFKTLKKQSRLSCFEVKLINWSILKWMFVLWVVYDVLHSLKLISQHFNKLF